MANFEWVTQAHRFLYHNTNGWIGGWLGRPMVLMHTIGAKTGLPRTIPLQCYPVDGDGVLVLASNNGQAKAPGWYFNLKAHPDIEVRLGRRSLRVHAEELSAEQRDEVWPAMRKQNSAIDRYAAKAGRVLPIMRLRPLP
ncbi:MAG TPA: nitroreductase family deazaflavin-dependent oxidoreductase [Alphaproteobacteria bacterium]|jgi:deazaflavin-dependent oxidoreductase (nitroreductase family)|nr:nitroreductase family deazaflavin-dependent oxidoreductase [Alphaproteobacteria bacterium]